MLTYQINKQKTDVDYLFIDGGYFDKVVQKVGKDFWNNENLKIDFRKLSKNYNKIFYYNCLPGKKDNENNIEYETRIDPIIHLYEELKLLDNFHVFEGITFGRKNKIRQKTVDIMIAVDMLSHSFRKNMNKAHLLTGDLDFKPLIEALVFEGMHVNIIYSELSISKELLYVADSNQRITIRQIHNWLPDNEQIIYRTPKFHQSLWIESPTLLQEGEIKGGKIKLWGRDENEYWIEFNNSTFWEHDSRENLVWFIEDLNNEKIKWIN